MYLETHMAGCVYDLTTHDMRKEVKRAKEAQREREARRE